MMSHVTMLTCHVTMVTTYSSVILIQGRDVGFKVGHQVLDVAPIGTITRATCRILGGFPKFLGLCPALETLLEVQIHPALASTGDIISLLTEPHLVEDEQDVPPEPRPGEGVEEGVSAGVERQEEHHQDLSVGGGDEGLACRSTDPAHHDGQPAQHVSQDDQGHPQGLPEVGVI